MYPTQKDNHRIGVIDAGIFPVIAGALMSGIGSALRGRGERRKQQAEIDTQFKRDENQFLANNPNFEQSAVGRRRWGGAMMSPDSFSEGFAFNPETGKNDFNLGRALDPSRIAEMLSSKDGGQFMNDLLSSGVSGIKRPDFKPPKVGGSFLGDLFSGMAGNAGTALMNSDGGGGFGEMPTSSRRWDLTASQPGFGG